MKTPPLIIFIQLHKLGLTTIYFFLLIILYIFYSVYYYVTVILKYVPGP